MHPTSLPYRRLPLLILLTLFGAPRVCGSMDEDPLKDLIVGLGSGRIEAPSVWLDVVSKEPRNTVTTLIRVLKEDGDEALQKQVEKQLMEACAYAARRHEEKPWKPVEWNRHCLVSMEIIQILGGATQVSQLVDLLAIPRKAEEQDYDTRSFMRPLKTSLLRACDRDALTLRVIENAYGSQTRDLDSQLLRILGSCDVQRTPDTLVNCLGKRHHFDAIVLTQLAAALRKPHLRISSFGLGAIRPLLGSPDAHTRQSAVRALGYADDTTSIRPMILMLDDTADSVRNETLLALQRITAMTIEGHPERWLHWFEEETDWWCEESPATLQTLRDSTEKDVARILRELAGKRLFRREIAPHVMGMLEDPRPEVVRLALATLESLRPPFTDLAPLLKELSEHHSPIVRNDANRILHYLTKNTNSLYPSSNIPSRH
ncbi:MAG: HEAT repeat domain-containing protein [bacterium]|nr:HEAT repeat domain-containing protein [bacterium]